MQELYVAEPPAAWLQRPMVVVDCSVLAAVLFEEPERARAAALLEGKALHAPHLLMFEIANVACAKRRKGFAADDLQRVLADLEALRVVCEPVAPAAVVDLALRWDLSAYDAAYLWLAASLQAPLITFDRRLADAAARHLAS